MRKTIALLLLASILLSGCGLGFGRRFAGGGGAGANVPAGTQAPPTITSTPLPTDTPVPTATLTPVPTADLGAVGLPTEGPSADALDFVETMCKAQWFTRGADLPCPGDPNNANGGFVIQLPGPDQGLSPEFPV